MITILGTHHSNKSSKEGVQKALDDLEPDIIFVELGNYRYNILSKNVDRVDKIKSRIGKNINLRPRGRMIYNIIRVQSIFNSIGSDKKLNTDFKPAMRYGNENSIEVIPVDRDLEETMNKLGREIISLGAIRRYMKVGGEKLPSNKKISADDIETLSDIETLITQKKTNAPKIHRILITERDRIMVDNISKYYEPSQNALAIVGAMHLPGVQRLLQERGFKTESIIEI